MKRLLLGLIGTVSAFSAPVLFDFQRVGSYHSQGVYNLVGLDTWNGQPVSTTNQPTPYQAELADTINFYISPTAPNDLFVQVTDVVTTHASYWNGIAFQNVSLTGIRFRLFPNQNINLPIPTFSEEYANPGEVLFTGNGAETVPLTDTPGYRFLASGNQYTIETANGVSNAFGTWGYVNGTTRIMGGGVFGLSFDSAVNLLSDVNFKDTTMDSIFGLGNQHIPAVEAITATPEPSTLGLFALCLVPFGFWYLRSISSRWT